MNTVINNRDSKLSVAVFSIVLIFMMAFFILILHNRSIYDNISKEISYLVELEDGLSNKEKGNIKASIESEKGVFGTSFISKKKALAFMSEEMEVLGNMSELENPFKDQFQFHIEASQSSEDIQEIVEKIKKIPQVNNVFYQKLLVSNIKRMMFIISIVFLGFALILLFINYSLMYNFIRLILNSNHKEIKTMQLVGAKASFIKKPYIDIITRIITQAMIYASFMVVMGYLVTYFYLPFVNRYINILFVALSIMGVGILSYIFAKLATNRILNKLLGSKLYN